MKEETVDKKHFVIDCLNQKMVSGGRANLGEYLRDRGVNDVLIPEILAEMVRIEQDSRTAKSRIQEGGVITAIGIGGIAYATANEKDGAAWLIWSAVGLGILANGLWKRKKIKKYNKL